MKNILVTILILTLYGCSSHPVEIETKNITESCLGSSDLPEGLASKFEKVEDKLFLGKALGKPNKGKLCQGQVYKSKEDSSITIFRAWNSTNSNSKLGKWWAFQKPTGEISKYRSEYEICYQWSPLDKLVSCTLKPEVTVVVGTGQSADCSDDLTYKVSDKQQIYIDDASMSLINCTTLSGEFSWK